MGNESLVRSGSGRPARCATHHRASIGRAPRRHRFEPDRAGDRHRLDRRRAAGTAQRPGRGCAGCHRGSSAHPGRVVREASHREPPRGRLRQRRDRPVQPRLGLRPHGHGHRAQPVLRGGTHRSGHDGAVHDHTHRCRNDVPDPYVRDLGDAAQRHRLPPHHRVHRVAADGDGQPPHDEVLVAGLPTRLHHVPGQQRLVRGHGRPCDRHRSPRWRHVRRRSRLARCRPRRHHRFDAAHGNRFYGELRQPHRRAGRTDRLDDVFDVRCRVRHRGVRATGHGQHRRQRRDIDHWQLGRRRRQVVRRRQPRDAGWACRADAGRHDGLDSEHRRLRRVRVR